MPEERPRDRQALLLSARHLDPAFSDHRVEPAVGPREEFVKYIANNRAFAARVAKEAGIQPQ